MKKIIDGAFKIGVLVSVAYIIEKLSAIAQQLKYIDNDILRVKCEVEWVDYHTKSIYNQITYKRK